VKSGPDRSGPYWVALIASLALILGGCAGSENATDLPLGRQVSAQVSVTPTVHLFAEPVVARAEVVVDREHLDPERIRLQAKFLPYDVKGFERWSQERGRLTVLTYEWTLRCLRLDCIPEVLPSAAGEAETGRGERRSLRLVPARVLYDDPGGKERLLTRGLWPELVSVSRIKQSDVPRIGNVFKVSPAPLPKPDYRVSPTLLGVGLLGAAAALLALPVAIGIGWWRRRRPAPVVEEEPELTPLERALRLVEWARGRENGAERREALEVLAVELDTLEHDELAESARTLAWSPASPAPESADELVRSVRRADG
jgi:hypothetical protein